MQSAGCIAACLQRAALLAVAVAVAVAGVFETGTDRLLPWVGAPGEPDIKTNFNFDLRFSIMYSQVILLGVVFRISPAMRTAGLSTAAVDRLVHAKIVRSSHVF
ncbi:hypothetical protein F5Y17DRAFT_197001 [Xylariaceae sp. FL0594]|nr:hypothetical protein F5Y17DRAFT_197001 [Xylariaceae sp. FL0594]